MKIESTSVDRLLTENLNPYEFQIQRPIEGVTLIGTKHRKNPSNIPQNRINEFRHAVTSQKTIAYEGTTQAKKAANTTQTIETLAARYAKKEGIKQVSLEDSFHLANILTKYNFDFHQYTALKLASFVKASMLVDLKQPSLFRQKGFDAEILFTQRSLMATEFPPLSIVSKDDITTIGNNLYNGMYTVNPVEMQNNIEIEQVGSRIQSWYKGRLRDYEAIGPNFVNLCNNTNQPIAAIVGEGHLPLLHAFVLGEEVTEPDSWPDIQNRLPYEIRRSVGQVLDWAQV